MESEIIQLIEELTGYDDLHNNKDVDLLEEDILDSLAFLQLMEQLEERYNVEIQPTQIKPDTWRYVDNIVKMIQEQN